jgi:hypothetical protein
MGGTAEHLEHIEHHQHAAHNPMDRIVAMTMAIVAAVLAAVTLLSHRAHNDTLRLQTEASRLQTEASDKWNEFQANNIRNHEYQVDVALLGVLTKEANKQSEARAAQKEWQDKVDSYKTKLPKLQNEAKDKEAQVKERQEESHLSHERGTRFDLGELGVELSLVLCSLCVLTKRLSFWYAGIGTGVLGVVIALTGFTLAPVPAHEGSEEAPAHATPAKHSSAH